MASGKIQNEDIKSASDLTGAGGTAAQLPNDDKIWVKALSINKTLNQAIADGDIGGGGGSKNYIDNWQANTDTAGWATYADAAGTRPVNGTGGSPTVTWTRTTSSPLTGAASFLFTKDAANRQGEGVSYDFTIDNADKGNMLGVTFYFSPTTGTFAGSGNPLTNSDLILYFYDVTNSVLIEPTPFVLDGSVNGSMLSMKSTFQTNSNSTSYRLILHVATTSASAYTVKFDDFVVGPNTGISSGVIVTDWKSDLTFTPSAGFGTVTGQEVRYRRVGDQMEIRAYWKAGTVAGSTGSISLPLPMNTSKLKTGSVNLVGYGKHIRTGATGGDFLNLQVFADPSTPSVLYFSYQTGGDQYQVFNVSSLLSNNDGMTFQAMIPIAGWDTNVSFSNAGQNQLVAAVYKGSDGASLSGSSTTFKGFTLVQDTSSIVNPTTGGITIPVAGFYDFSMQVNVDTAASAANQYIQMLLKTGTTNGSGTLVAEKTIFSSGASFNSDQQLNKVLYCNAGDTFHLEVLSTFGASRALTTSSTANFLQVTKVQNPSSFGSDVTVAAKVTTSSTTVGTTRAAVVFTVKDYDTHGAYNTSTGGYTVPVSGIYEVEAFTLANNTPSSTSVDVGVNLTVGVNSTSTVTSRIGQFTYQVTSVALSPGISGSCKVKVVAGDVIYLQIRRDAAVGSHSLINTSDLTWATFTKVG